ncbi:MAG: hypothetical protein ACK5M7_17560 [Draconibacterium sp.]
MPNSIDVLMDGLEHAKLKAGLCSDIGTLYFEDKKLLKEAVKWWIRSCAIQLGGGTADIAFPFLNLSAVASPFSTLSTEQKWLLDQADAIDHNRTRFNERGLAERQLLSKEQANDSLIAVIKQLCNYYSGKISDQSLFSQQSIDVFLISQSADVAIFIFDYDKMEISYGLQAFRAISKTIKQTNGICTFSHGDLEVFAGGLSAVPEFIIQLMAKGMLLYISTKNKQLNNLNNVKLIYGYAIALWTDSPANISIIHNSLQKVMSASYLGCLVKEQKVGGQIEFFDFVRPLQLPPAITFRDGKPLERTNRINL